MIKRSILICLVFILVAFGDGGKVFIEVTPKTLKGTSWTSQFYHYCNYYQFDTDSTGYSEDGQVAWSLPIDPDSIKEEEKNKILYDKPEQFNYELVGDRLVIQYQNWKIDGEYVKRVFIYSTQRGIWISEHEYSYGKEGLVKGEKREELK